MTQISPAKENSHTQPLATQQPPQKAQTALTSCKVACRRLKTWKALPLKSGLDVKTTNNDKCNQLVDAKDRTTITNQWNYTRTNGPTYRRTDRPSDQTLADWIACLRLTLYVEYQIIRVITLLNCVMYPWRVIRLLSITSRQFSFLPPDTNYIITSLLF